jgi:hypothetical protein
MQSEQINELADALAKAQGSIKSAAKVKNNPFFKSKYADLPAIWDACRVALTENSIAVIQSPQRDVDSHVWLETTLAHKSGQWMRSTYPINPTKNDPQGVGSAITYARRYALAAMVGIVADEDDDGNAASGRQESETAPSATVSTKQLETLRHLIAETGTDIEKFCVYLGIEALPDLESKYFDRALAALNKKRKPQAIAAE